jgi:hypothetical protein
VEYKNLLKRVRALDFSIKDFADFLDIKVNSVYMYSIRGVPTFVVRIVETLEKLKKAEDRLAECREGKGDE